MKKTIGYLVLMLVLNCQLYAEKLVNIVSLSFSDMTPDKVFKLIEQEAQHSPDFIVLPETWTGPFPESIEGYITHRIKELARTYKTYIIHPIYIFQDGKKFNATLVIDRNGEVIHVYNKIYPFWSELEVDFPVTPGNTNKVIETDVGTIGVLTCFDINFPHLWQELADQGADIIFWPSEYSGGQRLKAYALIHNYYIVSATLQGDCQIYDITGDRIKHTHDNKLNVTHITLDLDRGIYHYDFNEEKLSDLLQKNSIKLRIDKQLDHEKWFVLRSNQSDICARAAAKESGLEELRSYISRSKKEIDILREKT